MSETSKIPKKLLSGRTKIMTGYKSDEVTEIEDVLQILKDTMPEHLINAGDINYLINYKRGRQPILSREKDIRPEISNNVVINHAQMITRTAVGYFLGTPIQYIQAGGGQNKEAIDRLNRYVAFEDKASVDKEIGEFQSITGTAYRIIYTDGIYKDEVPFEDKALHPATTYVVYENTIAEKPVAGITYYEYVDTKNNREGKMCYVYTETGVWELLYTDNIVGVGDLLKEPKFTPYKIGGIPIIEYPNNMWRIGDWELCIGLMDAINLLDTNRLDDIDQLVQSLLVFVNAEMDEKVYDEMRKKGVVMLKNTTQHKSEVQTIQNSLDQSGMNLFAEEMEDLLYALIGIPNRNNRQGGGADTGQAVELRDGWADLEVLARNKELTFKRSEKKALRIILNIINNKEDLGITLLDVDIKFSRNKTNNLLVKSQSFSTLLATKTLSPQDCLTIVDLVSDVNEYISRGEKFWGDQFAKKNESGGNEKQFGETTIDDGEVKESTPNPNTEE